MTAACIEGHLPCLFTPIRYNDKQYFLFRYDQGTMMKSRINQQALLCRQRTREKKIGCLPLAASSKNI
jgi:hypothetical protein